MYISVLCAFAQKPLIFRIYEVNMLHIGLDVGSTTVKIAVLDDENKTVYKN